MKTEEMLDEIWKLNERGLFSIDYDINITGDSLNNYEIMNMYQNRIDEILRDFFIADCLEELLKLRAEKETELKKRCEWSLDEDGVYNTSCGNMFFFDTGAVVENGAKYCLYCGTKTKEV